PWSCCLFPSAVSPAWLQPPSFLLLVWLVSVNLRILSRECQARRGYARVTQLCAGKTPVVLFLELRYTGCDWMAQTSTALQTRYDLCTSWRRMTCAAGESAVDAGRRRP